MSEKTFGRLVIGGVLVILAALAAMVAVVDPFFQFHAPGSAETYENERYENAGMIQNLDYDTIVMGTSLACNYRASWFDELTGGKTIKIGFRGGNPVEFDQALRLAFDTHPDIKQVFFGMDLNILLFYGGAASSSLPDYLYNSTPLDDAAYFLNKDVYLRCAKTLLRRSRGGGVPLDDAYIWDGAYTFSRETALSNYERPDPADPLAEDYFFYGVDHNLVLFEGWLTEHPNTQFTFFLSPYSVLYWDYVRRTGAADARLAALERAVDALVDYENLRICCFLGEEDIITNLDNYTDYIHISGATTRRLAEEMTAGKCAVTRENMDEFFSSLRLFLNEYDYDAIFNPAA
ncbi:MAG: hypothetical protein HFF09_01515 [Oscillospiraceae bacterium]|nr:hypothetical protein [Oscillospiraceae bacterium]